MKRHKKLNFDNRYSIKILLYTQIWGVAIMNNFNFKQSVFGRLMEQKMSIDSRESRKERFLNKQSLSNICLKDNIYRIHSTRILNIVEQLDIRYQGKEFYIKKIFDDNINSIKDIADKMDIQAICKSDDVESALSTLRLIISALIYDLKENINDYVVKSEVAKIDSEFSGMNVLYIRIIAINDISSLLNEIGATRLFMIVERYLNDTSWPYKQAVMNNSILLLKGALRNFSFSARDVRELEGKGEITQDKDRVNNNIAVEILKRVINNSEVNNYARYFI